MESGTIFWSGGLANPLQVIEQITYLIFIKRLDEMQDVEERRATTLGAAGAAHLPRRQGRARRALREPALGQAQEFRAARDTRSRGLL
jgi:hypothetical protein